MKKNSIIKNKSFQFALKILKLYKLLIAENEYIISKQLFRIGAFMGAKIEEALAGQSKKDFMAKMAILSKVARETKFAESPALGYWNIFMEYKTFN